MSSILPLIRKRRSIRKYSNKKITANTINRILEAGRWAPSGLNNQPWRFFIIKDKANLLKISRFTKYSRIIEHAQLLILVFMDKRATYNKQKDFMAIGACIENMLLETTALKLGSCWLGEILINKNKINKLLAISNNMELTAAISIGYPLTKPKGCRMPLKKLILS